MKKRIGKDLVTRWTVTTNGVATSLVGRSLILEIAHTSAGLKYTMPFTIEGTNTVLFTWYGKNQEKVGTYTLTLWENKGKVNQTAIDTPYIELVAWTFAESGTSSSSLNVESVNLETSNIQESGRGYSAYECWLADGHTGTLSDFLVWLKGAKGDPGDKGDPGVGVPKGGMTGQVLCKKSETDYDTEWSNRGAGTVWGDITGTLSNQTDLNEALAGKVDKVSGKGLSTNDYSDTEKQKVTDAYNARHSHSNKELLDSYTQTEANIADAVGKKHSHVNKELLDTYTQTEANLADSVSKKHSHSNKGLLDTYTQTETNLADAVTKKHTHSNKNILDAIDAAPYAKPDGGIPKSDLASGVQGSLDKADSALQTKADVEAVLTGEISTHTHPHDATKQDVINESNKLSYSLISGTPPFPTKTSDLTNDSGFLTEHQDISGKLNKPAQEGSNGQVLTTDGQGGTSWATPAGGTDLTLVHKTLTASSNALTFAPTDAREYDVVSISANLALTLNISNANEHYLLVTNTSASAVTIAVTGASSETIIGSTAISVPANKKCEMFFIKDNGNYVVTYFVFE